MVLPWYVFKKLTKTKHATYINTTVVFASVMGTENVFLSDWPLKLDLKSQVVHLHAQSFYIMGLFLTENLVVTI